ncbi:hypothetical protein GTW98_15410 [Streptomyces sp. SID8375]|uniref:Integral membrane protein n=1 Tax=Streptomyces nigrescens TaxID=1920 RepID=A0A640TA18_STRNI|nr:hypothetical protein DKG71_40865 [Streptomyces sp. NEAU-S7GS2]MYT11046.1 hypothetical protein [Streptomyces sp. SID4951]MYX08171.1 hypothetical protein [Streptomyces sp. SID8375]GFE19852.1 hypothetical protein Sliba_03050 [Streptomyces libani subsp. libani]GGV85053.1 hypothetical protein GCM10010500_00600 [Streptomyces libani subsp. libani]
MQPPARRGEPLQRLLFGGVYGSVLASALAAALGHEGRPPDPGYDALWVALTAVASAAAHGYAHSIAHRTSDDRQVTASAVRSMLSEWPLVAAMLPTMAALFGAHLGWWGEESAIEVALGLNLVALFGWGVWAARVAERRWGASFRVGCVDVMIGLLIVIANVLSK